MVNGKWSWSILYDQSTSYSRHTSLLSWSSIGWYPRSFSGALIRTWESLCFLISFFFSFFSCFFSFFDFFFCHFLIPLWLDTSAWPLAMMVHGLWRQLRQDTRWTKWLAFSKVVDHGKCDWFRLQSCTAELPSRHPGPKHMSLSIMLPALTLMGVIAQRCHVPRSWDFRPCTRRGKYICFIEDRWEFIWSKSCTECFHLCIPYDTYLSR